MGDLLHLDGPGHVIVGIEEKDLVVGLQGGLAGDDYFLPGTGPLSSGRGRIGVSFGEVIPLAVTFPGGEVAAEVFP